MSCTGFEGEVMGRGEMNVGWIGLGRSRYVWFVTGAES